MSQSNSGMPRSAETIFLAKESDEYYFDEGCFILEMLNSESDPEVSIARARVEAGKTTRVHRLQGVTERYVIQQGKGVVTVGNQAGELVCVGGIVVIPAGEKQSIYNPGPEPLVFLAICSPRFTLECYQDVDV